MPVLPVESQGYQGVRDPFIGICLGEIVLAVPISFVVVMEPGQVVEVHRSRIGLLLLLRKCLWKRMKRLL